MHSGWENKQMKLINRSGIALHGVQPGEIIEIKADSNGVPIDKHWRRRLKDASIDGCVEVVPEQTAKSSKKEAE